jgi:hypothetical protein
VGEPLFERQGQRMVSIFTARTLIEPVRDARGQALEDVALSRLGLERRLRCQHDGSACNGGQ